MSANEGTRGLSEAILEPELPIVDPHHHMWDRRPLPPAPLPDHPAAKAVGHLKRYMLDELAADTRSGHNVVATVYMECGFFAKADGPKAFRSVGETEAVNGVAAMSAAGVYGGFRACAGIVGHVELTLGDLAAEVLQAHVLAGGGRFRGVRNLAGWDEDPFVTWPIRAAPSLYLQEDFRRGFRHLAPLGLSFDAWVLEPQLGDVLDLARAFPETTIILNHLGAPLGLGRWAGTREARFPIWRRSMAELAGCPNVVVKVGGLGQAFTNFPSLLADPPVGSAQLADEWRPYVEAAIELFGVDRCMFESNWPSDAGCGAYATIWNAFKRLAAGATADEKTALFSGTARRVYRLELP